MSSQIKTSVIASSALLASLLASGCFFGPSVVSTSASTTSGLSFAGISGVTSVTSTGAVLEFAAASPSNLASELRAYCQARSGSFTLVQDGISPSATSATLTGLNTGTTYACKVQVVDSSGNEIANDTTVSFQTTPTMAAVYQGISLVQAYGSAPSAPSGTPQSQQIMITWQPFTGATGGTSYALMRVAKGGTFDMNATGACTSATSTTCEVCSPTGAGAQSCTDTNVGGPPTQYDYAVTWIVSSNVEELPASTQASYRITVPVPPSNMVLVHRDAANFEMCTLMGKTTDPLNHQRCVYSGLGATPYNSNPGNAPLGLPSGYYDFGYNLFIDRWTAACNWTPSSAGGMCGAGATAGNCYGSLGYNGSADLIAPSSTIGANGNVFYDAEAGGCWINVSGTWKSINDSTLTTAQQAAMYTITPSSSTPEPPLTQLYQTQANAICSAVVDPNYGAKRLLRRREYIAAAAWPWLPNDPATIISNKSNPWPQIAAVEYESSATHLTTNNYCNTNSATGLTCNFPTGDCAGDSSGNTQSVVIGAASTKNCVSRFGAQDMVGNVVQWVSDQVDQCNAGSSHSCTGITSNIDSGNQDLSGFYFDGSQGHNQGPGGTADGQLFPGGDTYGFSSGTLYWQLSTGVASGSGIAQGYGSGYFSTPLGIPMVGNDSGNALSIGSGYMTASTALNTEYFFLYSDATYTTNDSYNNQVNYYGPLRGGLVGGNWYEGSLAGRWMLLLDVSPWYTYQLIGFRCGAVSGE